MKNVKNKYFNAENWSKWGKNLSKFWDKEVGSKIALCLRWFNLFEISFRNT